LVGLFKGLGLASLLFYLDVYFGTYKKENTMKFKDLENAVCGKTVLVDRWQAGRVFVGWTPNGMLVTNSYGSSDDCRTWIEPEIKGWTIKKETRKFWVWLFLSEGNFWKATGYLYDDSFKDSNDNTYGTLADSPQKRKVESSMVELDEDGRLV